MTRVKCSRGSIVIGGALPATGVEY
jgi:hypothetical protein